MEWIQTDDFQYCRKIAEDKYELIQANYCEGDYIISEAGIVDLTEWIKDGEYTEDCKLIIDSYYKNEKEFKESYLDIDTRKQILAEMIYESISIFSFRYGRVTEEQAEKILEHYVETGEYLKIGE